MTHPHTERCVNESKINEKVFGGPKVKSVLVKFSFVFWGQFEKGCTVFTYSNNAEKIAELVRLIVLELLTQRDENVLDLTKRDFASAFLVKDLRKRKMHRKVQ